jgi:hypothetical protein
MPRKKSDAPDPGADTPESARTEAEAEAAAPVPAPSEAAAGPDSEPGFVDPPAAPASASEPPAWEPEAAPARDHAAEAEEHHEEEAGPSFAARALTFLLVLLAGAGLAIWGAPRLAPHLPAGLAPVAAWLTPGAREAEARIAALEARLDAGLAGFESRFGGVASSGDVDARIAAAVAATEQRLGGEINALKEAVAQVDGAGARQSIARLQSALDGQAAELATLKEQFTAAAAGAAAGTLSQEAVEQIDVYRAELDGLRAEMGTLSDQVQTLGARIDEVAAQADRQIETAQSRVAEIQASADTALGRAEIDGDLALVRAAIAGGQPFAEPLDRIAAHPGVTVPEGLAAAAPTGVATLAALRDSYPDAAHAAIRASVMASAGEGILARTRAFIGAQVASRSLTPRAGADPDAVLSRVEDRLRRDDLDGALAEAGQLPSEAAAAMDEWLGAARLRAGAVAGLASLDSALQAMN